MTISGRVHYAMLAWDDGGANPASGTLNDDDVVFTTPLGSTRLSIDGRGRINSDWEAGYRFRIKVEEDARGITVGQGTRPGKATIQDDEHYFFLRSKTLGAISLGRRGQAHGGAAKVDVSGKTGLVANADPRLYGGGIQLRNTSVLGLPGTGGFVGSDIGLPASGAGSVTIATVYQVDDGDDGAGENNGIRYDSPTIGGFVLSADWTNDGTHDEYGVRLSYANQFGDFKVVGAAAWYTQDDANDDGVNDAENSSVLGSIGIMHIPTGLFVNAGAGETDYDTAGDANANFWYVTAGIQQKWTSLGATTIYGQYYSSEDNSLFGGGAFDEHDADYWGFGIVQTIDAVGMDLYAGYRRYEADIDSDLAPFIDGFKEVDTVVVGGVINF